ncbi:MAG: outer membrane protein transport protein [Chlamydiota bacterium]|nr:outer membrane protein transport protein [Chlamydiota bacterium]
MKKCTKKYISVFLISVPMVILLQSSVLAIGFRLPDQGSAAHGQGSAFTAEASDPTAVYYNPAAITRLEGVQTYTGAEFIFLSTDYTTLSGQKVESDNTVGILPQLYITGHLNEKVGIGLGINSIYGLSTDYGETSPLRYVTTYSELLTANFSPVVAYAVNPQLSLAAGLDVTYGKADLRRNVDFGALAGYPGSMDGHLIVKGDGEGVGFNLAAHYQPHEQHAFGLTYRSAIDLDLDGSVSLNQIPAFVGAGESISGDASTTIKLPSALRFGYAYWPKPEWKIEFDFEWADWSRFDKFTIESQNPLVPTSDAVYNYNDSFILGLGTQYEINEHWTARCGYMYADKALPDATFDPVVPDSNRHAVNVGLSYNIGSVTLSVAYQAIFFEDRDINNDVGAGVGSSVDGRYESFVNAFSFGVRWEI